VDEEQQGLPSFLADEFCGVKEVVWKYTSLRRSAGETLVSHLFQPVVSLSVSATVNVQYHFSIVTPIVFHRGVYKSPRNNP
jgi:hypothetical protein